MARGSTDGSDCILGPGPNRFLSIGVMASVRLLRMGRDGVNPTPAVDMPPGEPIVSMDVRRRDPLLFGVRE